MYIRRPREFAQQEQVKGAGARWVCLTKADKSFYEGWPVGFQQAELRFLRMSCKLHSELLVWSWEIFNVCFRRNRSKEWKTTLYFRSIFIINLHFHNTEYILDCWGWFLISWCCDEAVGGCVGLKMLDPCWSHILRLDGPYHFFPSLYSKSNELYFSSL